MLIYPVVFKASSMQSRERLEVKGLTTFSEFLLRC